MIIRTPAKSILSVVIASTALLIQSAVQAQNSDLNDLLSLQLDELGSLSITTGSHLIATDQSNSLVTSSDYQQWSDYGIRNTQDALNRMPGMLSLPTFGGGQAINIRGYTNELSNRGVATLLDGVPINVYAYGTGEYTTSQVELGILQQIEVVRGPGSAVYGSDAFHGVFSQRSYRSGSDETLTDATAASDGFKQFNLRHSQGLKGSPLRYQFAFGSSVLPDQQRSYSYPDLTVAGTPQASSERAHAYDSQSMLHKLSWGNFRQSGEVALIIDRLNTQDMPGMGTHFFAGNFVQQDTDLSSQQGLFTLINAKNTYQLSDQAEIISKLFHWRNEHELVFDNTGLIDGLGIPPHRAKRNDVEIRSGLELGWRHTFSKHQSYLAIGFNQQNIVRSHLIRRTPDGLNIVDMSTGFDNAKRNISSLISENQTELGNWSFNYGARLDHDSDFGSRLTPRISSSYQIANNHRLLALYSEGFRAGIASEQYTDGRLQGNLGIKPEKLANIEFSWRYDSQIVHTYATLFRSRWTDRIELQDVPDDPAIDGRYENSGDSSAMGWELGYDLNLGPWDSQGDLSYAISKDEDNSEAASSDEFYVTYPKLIANLSIGRSINTKWRIFVTNRVHAWAKATKLPEDHIYQDNLATYWRTDLTLKRTIKQQGYGQLIIRNLLNRDNRLPSIWDAHNGLKDEEFSLGLELGYAFR